MIFFRTRSGGEPSSLKIRSHVRWFLINMNQQEKIDKLLELSKLAYSQNEVPISCLITYQDKIIATSYNQIEKHNSCFEHAEIIALKKAYEKLNTKNLNDCEIYISLEPCLMCLGAIINSHIKKIYFLCLDNKKGAFSYYNIQPSVDNLEIHYIENKETKELLTNFFKTLRK